jgi:cytochrome b subunit of formate dehydrogenase
VNPSDSAPALIALDAKFVVQTPKGERVVDAEDYFVGPEVDITRMNILQPGHLLTAIRIPSTWAGTQFYFEKIRDRNVWDFPLMNVASAMILSGDTIQNMRIAVNAAAARPLRLKAVEQAERRHRRNGGEAGGAGCRSTAVQCLQNPADAESSEARHQRSEGGSMGIIEWAMSPLGQNVPIHIAWFLIWVALIAGLLFLVVHAIYIRYFAKEKEFVADASPTVANQLPARIPRHSLVARLFHWIMAASMFTLLFTAFLPKVGVQFDWVTYHWIAGTVLTISIIFHVIHASFYMDFWSIWPDRADLEDAGKRFRRFMGKSSALPRKFAKYPLENKLYHGAIVVTGMSVILTGVFMMSRVRTIFFPRNPYWFSDMTWGLMYVLHGLAGVGLITLIVVHVYFAIRPEKLPITASMIVGTMSREFYLKEHDPKRWVVETSSSSHARGRG